MKVYKKTSFIANSEGNIFHQYVAEEISKLQNANLTVEVQYQTIGLTYSALILGYTEE